MKIFFVGTFYKSSKYGVNNIIFPIIFQPIKPPFLPFSCISPLFLVLSLSLSQNPFSLLHRATFERTFRPLPARVGVSLCRRVEVQVAENTEDPPSDLGDVVTRRKSKVKFGENHGEVFSFWNFDEPYLFRPNSD